MAAFGCRSPRTVHECLLVPPCERLKWIRTLGGRGGRSSALTCPLWPAAQVRSAAPARSLSGGRK